MSNEKLLHSQWLGKVKAPACCEDNDPHTCPMANISLPMLSSILILWVLIVKEVLIKIESKRKAHISYWFMSKKEGQLTHCLLTAISTGKKECISGVHSSYCTKYGNISWGWSLWGLVIWKLWNFESEMEALTS